MRRELAKDAPFHCQKNSVADAMLIELYAAAALAEPDEIDVATFPLRERPRVGHVERQAVDARVTVTIRARADETPL